LLLAEWNVAGGLAQRALSFNNGASGVLKE